MTLDNPPCRSLLGTYTKVSPSPSSVDSPAPLWCCSSAREFFRKDGTRVPVLVGVARFKEPRNQAVVFALDISKQKRKQATALDARMIEQTRIARKLHDALLQNFQGIMFRFQAARNMMPRHPDEALRSLNDAISEGEKALDESREAIQDLRSNFEGDLG